MKIKICGIKSEDDVEIINRYRPDFIGFIFYPPSKRYITQDQASRLAEHTDRAITKVGVFVNAPVEEIIKLYLSGTIDWVQLHGDENQSEIDILKEKGIPVVKAVKLKTEEDLSQVEDLKPDYFLFDVRDTILVGGTGRSFDWDILKNYSGDIPYFLAGGIKEDNLNIALKTDAYALDISSGAETDGKKDKEKIKNLVRQV